MIQDAVAWFSHGRAWKSTLISVAGVLIFGAAWELIGRSRVLGSEWPPLSTVLNTLVAQSNRETFVNALQITAKEAAIGYVAGCGAAFVSGVLTVFLPPVRPVIFQFAVAVNAIPIIALGPVLIAIFPREVAPSVLAALAVYFITLVAVTTGLASTPGAHSDLLRVLGASRIRRFTRLQLPNALPLIVNALQVAAPSAVLGAILGEWFGSPFGLGPIIVIAMQDGVYDLLWAAALIGVSLSLVAFGLLGVIRSQVYDQFGAS